jgi:phage/conjugal plasmid C-4 type zinc finger TraR family protein
MSDIIDDAQQEEMRIRSEALDRARAKHPDPGPLFIDGVACCRDCEEPILSARLKAKPGCGRCVPCQGEAERT